ncbi:MAG: ADP-ribosylglycohydrolase family protein [Dehalococcoidia bacterium]|nr:ADP-ribosylglycohydrolase family protein [Dehalococcoidia bacterium]
MPTDKLTDKIYGCLLGGLIGDAMGAPTEGMHYRQIIEKFGPEGVTDFEGVGTDDTAIRGQLIDAIYKSDGHPTVDHFAQSFADFRDQNRHLWFIPVRNAFHKFDQGVELPAYAGWGNMQSSSTAMAISPMGIINACNPRQAALETMDVASFIHNGPSGYCRDAACAMAAAVAAAFDANATIESVVDAATRYLLPVSAGEIKATIAAAMDLAAESDSYELFRENYYARFQRTVLADSMETIPATLAILTLAEGDPERAITWGANFGRDADTIATMVGGVVGALHGASGLPSAWVAKVEANADVTYRDDSQQLADVVRRRMQESKERLANLESLG